MKQIYLLVIVLTLGACTTIQKSTNIPSTVQAYEYNSIASQYLARPTFLRIDNLTNGNNNLLVMMNMYNGQVASFAVERKNVDENIKAIVKFLEWERLARERGDIFTKQIAEVVSWKNDGADISNRYEFHSGNEKNHYLEISSCALGICMEKVLFFTPSEAMHLINTLENFKAGKITKTEIDTVYQ